MVTLPVGLGTNPVTPAELIARVPSRMGFASGPTSNEAPLIESNSIKRVVSCVSAELPEFLAVKFTTVPVA